MANFLSVQDNLIYNVRGHAIYFESGAEIKNLIHNNCIVDIRSCNIDSTDYFPAGIFVQNPDNEIIGNRVSESDAYGIWYNLPEHPEIRGKVYDLNIWPRHVTLNQCDGNVAHTNQKDGFVIWPEYSPRETPGIEPLSNPIIAEFKNFLGYNNGGNGAMAYRVGAVQFQDFRVANNLLANMEYSYVVNDIADGFAKIVGGWSLGKSANWNSAKLTAASPYGIILLDLKTFR